MDEKPGDDSEVASIWTDGEAKFPCVGSASTAGRRIREVNNSYTLVAHDEAVGESTHHGEFHRVSTWLL